MNSQDPQDSQTENSLEEQQLVQDQSLQNDPTIALSGELQDQKDKFLRLYAEFDNFKRRTAKERIDLVKTASQDLIQDLLSVVDDFERAEKLSVEQNNPEIFPEGMKLVYQKLIAILKSRGLEPMDTTGQAFDSALHEAITEFPSPEESMKGKVFDTLEKGYFIHDKIIRFAKVVVAK